MEEIELKFLEVDVAELEKKLIKIGAKRVDNYEYNRKLFDYPDGSMNDRHGWIRVRTDGKETTLTYKQTLRKKLNEGKEENVGVKEIEVVVDDYEKTCELMKAIGLIVTTEEKNTRTRYEKDDVVFDIDSWPFIPTYLEIESSSFKKVHEAARELDLDPKNGIIGSAGTIYKRYGFDTGTYSSITFEGMIKK